MANANQLLASLLSSIVNNQQIRNAGNAVGNAVLAPLQQYQNAPSAMGVGSELAQNIASGFKGQQVPPQQQTQQPQNDPILSNPKTSQLFDEGMAEGLKLAGKEFAKKRMMGLFDPQQSQGSQQAPAQAMPQQQMGQPPMPSQQPGVADQPSMLNRALSGIGKLLYQPGQTVQMGTDMNGNPITANTGFKALGGLIDPYTLSSFTGLGLGKTAQMGQAGRLGEKMAESQSVPLSKARKEEMALQNVYDINKAEIAYGVDIKKDEIKKMNGFFKSVLNPAPISAEMGTKIEYYNTAKDSLDNLNNIFNSNPADLNKLNVPGSSLGQKLAYLNKRLKTSLSRAQGGAALSKQEVQAIDSIASLTGYKNHLKDPSTIKFQLDDLINSTNRQLNILQPNEKIKNYIRSAKQNGISEADIYAVLKKKGDV